MSLGILTVIRCHVFLLVLISIIFHAEALRFSKSWDTFGGEQCSWGHYGENLFQLEHKNYSGRYYEKYALIIGVLTLNQSDSLQGQFCLKFHVLRFKINNIQLTFKINSHEYRIGDKADTIQKCIPYDAAISNGYDFKVTFNATCNPLNANFPNPVLSKIETSILKTGINPTSGACAFQYLGVVVGATCMALFKYLE